MSVCKGFAYRGRGTELKVCFGALALALLLSGCGDDQPPQSLPEKPVVSEQPLEVPSQAVPLPSASPESPPRAVKTPQAKAAPVPGSPPVRIDLRVSQEMIDSLHFGELADDEKPEPLLPPLFGEKPKAESKFQFNGRLLLNEQLKDDYVKSVEGAELKFQFKH